MSRIFLRILLGKAWQRISEAIQNYGFGGQKLGKFELNEQNDQKPYIN